jgi:hypothetical protein
MDTVTHELLLETLHLDETTGIFTYKKRRGSGGAGQPAGTLQKNSGQFVITLFGHTHSRQRLRYFYENGHLPSKRIPKAKNKARAVRGSVKYRGVTMIKSGKNGVRYVAQYQRNGVSRYLGCHDTAIEASEAYNKFEAEVNATKTMKERHDHGPFWRPTITRAQTRVKQSPYWQSTI